MDPSSGSTLQPDDIINAEETKGAGIDVNLVSTKKRKKNERQQMKAFVAADSSESKYIRNFSRICDCT
ncbi:hypothetical protein HPP92_011607 [Vanilla planifolia]|uniref:Uncharacterized protein n=1 Tax=Vanilla planifolia TaxID=51239 RepID=A0A835R261_VANPL|nr:hypothetical protein HPP92_011607 [Vanilla planifolia]